jgi:hypothetical protein
LSAHIVSEQSGDRSAATQCVGWQHVAKSHSVHTEASSSPVEGTEAPSSVVPRHCEVDSSKEHSTTVPS